MKSGTKVKTEITTFGGLSRSDLMSRVPSKENKTTEIKLASLLRKNKISGWRRHFDVLGTPDFAWPKEKLAVFIDGCFWHGHNCKKICIRTNSAYWYDKIRKNRNRDRRVANELKRSRWKVVRIWECDLRKSPEKSIQRISQELNLSN